MPETFLILLAGGVMLAAAISDPKAVTLRWLRLAGIIALSMTGLAAYFAHGRAMIGLTSLLILGQLAFVQVAYRNTQRLLATLASACAIATGTIFLNQLHEAPILNFVLVSMISAAVMGIALMDMLLGHAYLTASQMTMSPFMRLNRAVAVSMLLRAILSVVGTVVLQSHHPIEMFWNLYGLYVGTRWLVGLLVPGVFIYMAHDCIKRRATQSATGILYVTGVLIFIGEIIGLYVTSQTGLPV
ncbi:MAG TPA: hypothetical protein VHD56_13610 [Tepidisphaeraceae bacterium]|nr:hypothetical protein [Tepidisphaeraceae bacterium]